MSEHLAHTLRDTGLNKKGRSALLKAFKEERQHIIKKELAILFSHFEIKILNRMYIALATQFALIIGVLFGLLELLI